MWHVVSRRRKRHAVLLGSQDKPSHADDATGSQSKECGSHLAKSFGDTSSGATHYFYDEHGKAASVSHTVSLCLTQNLPVSLTDVYVAHLRKPSVVFV